MSAAEPPQRAVQWTVLLGATALIVCLCLLILRPFADVIAWSAVLATAFHPVHRYLVLRTGHVAVSAFVCSVLVVMVILMPASFLTGLGPLLFAIAASILDVVSAGDPAPIVLQEVEVKEPEPPHVEAQ